MSRKKQKLLISALTLILSLGLSFAHQKGWVQDKSGVLSSTQPGYYNVLEFSDGDTIVVDMNGVKETIRLIGVDTPETRDPRKAVQCYGQAASDFTKKLVNIQPVRLEADATNSNRDRYDRLLRYVYLPDGTLVQAEIIRQGYGFAYTAFPFTKLNEFRALEDQARQENRGLWASCITETESNGAIHTNDVL